jgi:UDP-GlcNAc:undecaprenyl-phosphate GlcNAc-1-phosphate transferase
VTWLAARAASRAGFVDDAAVRPDRKLQDRPVPAVGGFAILAGLAVAQAVPVRLWLGLGAAFLLGTLDDRRRGGLAPALLLAGQALVAASLIAVGWRISGGPPALAAAASFLAVLAAVNAVNTFDNADGAAASIGILGLSAGAPVLAAPLVGFLPWNLAGNRASKPVAYLGNAGSHVLGVLLLLDPIARFALALPLVDLARLAVVRLRAGSRPWIGDRRHLAHRLQRAGLPTVAVAIVLLVLAAPAVAGVLLGPVAAVLGVLGTSLLFAAAVFATRRVG